MRYAIIPARGGSKRIPRKNIKEFLGVPMITRVIETLLSTRLFDKVVVSTDSQEIADIARKAGALVPFIRPDGIADDYSGIGSVIAHAVDEMNLIELGVSSVCCVYPTSVLLRAEDLLKSIDTVESGNWKYVFSATKFDAPVQRSFLLNTGHGVDMLFPNEYKTRSQDLPAVYHDAGMFYWGSPQTWLDQSVVFGADSTIVEIPSWHVQDIDNIDDFEKAEIKYGLMYKVSE